MVVVWCHVLKSELNDSLGLVHPSPPLWHHWLIPFQLLEYSGSMVPCFEIRTEWFSGLGARFPCGITGSSNSSYQSMVVVWCHVLKSELNDSLGWVHPSPLASLAQSTQSSVLKSELNDSLGWAHPSLLASLAHPKTSVPRGKSMEKLHYEELVQKEEK